MTYNIIPLPTPRGHMTYRGAVTHVLSRMEAEAWSPELLPGETAEEMQARLEAASDIADDLLAEFAAEVDSRTAEIVAALNAEYADLEVAGALLSDLRADLEGAA